MDHVSDIKLIRTDTTLDLSQKAEKGMLSPFACFSFHNRPLLCSFSHLFRVGHEHLLDAKLPMQSSCPKQRQFSVWAQTDIRGYDKEWKHSQKLFGSFGDGSYLHQALHHMIATTMDHVMRCYI